MSTLERRKIGRPPGFIEPATLTFRLDKKLQTAFSELAVKAGKTQSELIRDFMLQSLRDAGKEHLLKN